MSGSISVAAIQMDAAFTSIDDRLRRAEKAVQQAVEAGAKLVVLPRQFATGYSYDDIQYELSQTLDDAIVNWMKQQASLHDVHLAGSVLLWDVDEVFNAALLVSPDGRLWRYDQQFPFLWERALFRDGDGTLVAHTELGRIGVMVGWDVAHPDIWMRYAANVDLLIVLHSMPDWSHAQIQFADGVQVVDLSGIARLLPFADVFATYLQQMASWMDVPVIVAGSSGHLDTLLPLPRLTLLPLSLANTELLAFLHHAGDGHLHAPFIQATGIYSGGSLLTDSANDGDQVATAKLDLPVQRPMPQTAQPAAIFPESLVMAIDALSAAAYAPVYQRSQRRQWGARMAPASAKTRIWLMTTLFALIMGFVTGMFAKRLQR